MYKYIVFIFLIQISFVSADLKKIKNDLKQKISSIEKLEDDKIKELLDEMNSLELTYSKEMFFPYWKVYVLNFLKKDNLTLQSIDRVLSMDSNIENMYRIKGEIFFKKKKYKRAIAIYKKGIEHSKDPYVLFLKVGKTYKYLGNYAHSIDFFGRASRINPKNKESYLEMAKVYILMDETNKELMILKKGKKLTKDPIFNYYIGLFYDQKNDVDQATLFFEDYFKETHEYKVIPRLEKIYDTTKDVFKQIALYENVLKMDKNNLSIFKKLIECYKKIKDKEKVDLSYDLLLADFELVVKDYLDIFNYYQENGFNEKAIEVMNRGIEKFRDNLYLYSYRADIYFILGEEERSLSDYEKAEVVLTVNQKENYEKLKERFHLMD